MEKMKAYDKLAGGLYGLLIGDALGVPYEFYEREELPDYEDIDMVRQKGLERLIRRWRREPGRMMGLRPFVCLTVS